MAPSLDVVVLDLRYLSQRNGGVFPSQFVRDVIDGRETRASHGPPGMPAWGSVFSAQEGLGDDAQARVKAKIDGLVAHLLSMQIHE